MAGVLFADLSRHCGIAFDGPGGKPVTMLWQLPAPGGNAESGWEYGRIFSAFRRRLWDLVVAISPDAIGFEAAINVMGRGGPAQRYQTSQHTIRILYGLVAVTEEVASTFGVNCYEANIATIKKHLTGNGRAEKPEMIAMCKQLGWDVGDDDNRADAAAGWAYLKALREPRWAPNATPLFKGART